MERDRNGRKKASEEAVTIVKKMTETLVNAFLEGGIYLPKEKTLQSRVQREKIMLHLEDVIFEKF